MHTPLRQELCLRVTSDHEICNSAGPMPITIHFHAPFRGGASSSYYLTSEL